MFGSAAQLYEEDFVRWTEQQSRALREAVGVGTSLPLGKGSPEAVARLKAARYTEDQVLGDWFPGEDPLPAGGEREG